MCSSKFNVKETEPGQLVELFVKKIKTLKGLIISRVRVQIHLKVRLIFKIIVIVHCVSRKILYQGTQITF